ncbi:isocitrate lyase/PEP mutase family protein [Micromonospora halophytica]|uniref:2-Methylisocitrate lyase, PEP mutase family n=1 Tax=Micromonospora halophytica TaxID=47864 RepID=A0A1C5HG08_9ACTN|nr:isocitrate lyase/phosphoenolpyruvate mutase family protein [Micromonospora halophytica]SCG44787.1 2-Methylisocitrate lyase, PEP mutase family [Micromonospora halophytica]
MTDPYAAFRALHRPGRPLLLPNAWDHASGAALAAAGYPAIGTTSLGVAAAGGKPDGAGATGVETMRLATLLVRLPVLVTVDVEAGFGDDPDDVARYVARLAALGVVGINLEDGRPDGTLADPAAVVATIAAVKARVPALFVNARTDTWWLRAPDPLGQALLRARAYRRAGADGVFVPGVTDPATVRTLAARVDAPLNVLAQPGGPDLDTLGRLGVARVSTGSLLFRAALAAVVGTAEAVRAGIDPGPGVPSYADVQAMTARRP